MRGIYIFLFVLLLLGLLSCDSFMSGTSSDQFYNKSYMSLTVGDVRQIISVMDSSTLLWTVTGKTLRRDGVSVFCMEWKTGTSSRNTLYYLIKDGFFLGTELDTTSRSDIDLSVNPFNEQRLAKLYPSHGEKFVHTPGELDSVYWVSVKDEPVKTFCGVFDKVYSFLLFGNSESMQLIRTFYAQGVGYIGTSGFPTPGLDFMVSYVKVGNQTIGSLWPEKDSVGGTELVDNNDLYKFLINGFLLSSEGKTNESP